jgi:hypothetical protein
VSLTTRLAHLERAAPGDDPEDGLDDARIVAGLRRR